ncbi:hypothetical protein [Cohnella abietis]|uniref:DUF1795 domain-containing protein n=1 Tax=Cohnella abietis TaxID=2507935 RepID=A0A3T1D4J9_9BACL|nr:hypothetical protein [Cohnella abietis]BBI33024.1 hypothetical protein KCTCHS21_24230 [Cohnella abietis]
MYTTSKKSFKMVIFTLLTVLILSGCNLGEAKSKIFTSENEEIQLTASSSWKKDPTLATQSTLGISQRKAEKYAMVTKTPKTDLASDATLEDYKNVFLQSSQSSVTDYEETAQRETTIDSSPALMFEVTGEVTKIKIHYLVALVDKPDGFYQILTWSTKSGFVDHKEELDQVIQSFKVLKTTTEQPKATNTPKSSSETEVKTSEDGKLEITIPKGWDDKVELMPDADIQAMNGREEEYLVILRESKSDFADDFSLEEYRDIIIDNMAGSLINANVSEPKKLVINGMSALQYEISGEMDKLKVSYLATIIESDNNFTQVLFWTLLNRMENKREAFAKAASTFKDIN